MYDFSVIKLHAYQVSLTENLEEIIIYSLSENIGKIALSSLNENYMPIRFSLSENIE